VISVTCYGQEFPPQKLEQFDFTSIETKVSANQKLNILKRLVFSEYLMPTEFKTTESYDFENYHLLDFNADGKLDIIYDGRNPMGIETNNVVFFLNREDSLIPVIKLNGDFTKIEIQKSQLVGFQLLKSPCCANFIYRIEDYKFSYSNDCFEPINGNHEYYKYWYGQVNDFEFCVSLISKYAYVKKTEFPTKIEFNRSSIVTSKVYLTPKPSEPSNIDFKEYKVAFNYMDNKAISQLPEGTICEVLSEKMNEKGNTFCFVVLVLNEEEKNYMNRIKFKHYGWLNKEKLK
tara:strand:+ start:1214 stop:2080 length:867 start_codon:yes stop_codon:yes gene_type:complete